LRASADEHHAGAVQQRTREIGIEKALGARRHHILIQFLAERWQSQQWAAALASRWPIWFQ